MVVYSLRLVWTTRRRAAWELDSSERNWRPKIFRLGAAYSVSVLAVAGRRSTGLGLGADGRQGAVEVVAMLTKRSVT
jgi:hypothetical protein